MVLLGCHQVHQDGETSNREEIGRFALIAKIEHSSPSMNFKLMRIVAVAPLVGLGQEEEQEEEVVVVVPAGAKVARETEGLAERLRLA